MSQWHTLLDRTIRGLTALKEAGQPTPEWVLGGGTALMIQARHRLSKDIDAFIDDPQYLDLLSPRLGGEEVWGCQAYDEATHYLKLRYPEGEIDFIVSSLITEIPVTGITIPAEGNIPSYGIIVEHPVEIAIKKINYRGDAIKIRDAFDICVVDTLHHDLLSENLHLVSHKKRGTLSVLSKIERSFFDQYLEELDILPEWTDTATISYDRIREIIQSIPDR